MRECFKFNRLLLCILSSCVFCKIATVKLAEDDGNLLKVFLANKQTAGFNPFD